MTAAGPIGTADAADLARVTTPAGARERLVGAGLDADAVETVIAEALDEDLGGRGVLPAGTGHGVDVTSVATVAADATASAAFTVRRPGTVAGLDVAAAVLALVCAPVGPLEVVLHSSDGDRVEPGDVVMTVHAGARALLTAERVALNLLTLMSGTATATRTWVDALAGTGTRVRDSRKTLPGLRMLQKYAVRVAGGVNHRMSLADAALIKDNHVIAAGGVVPAFEAVRAAFPDVWVQVEVTSAQQARDVVAAGAQDVLLDNMTIAEMTAVVAELRGRATFEASGGLTLASAAAVATTGVDFVAVGAITHSAPILDIALEFN
ncbi:nicotinate-nucleotide pyrophosphorylase [carboxylating] [Friedmanniella luteola]|uniref:Nicotinate-nucleotide pyrophosphorylase [carboxylating] n=1 Tax=Friedmanniella luteola TaxID=546871 RepID=A0A1H1LQT1_9ACTN|nr:carboxylating nicotinate-nucleotide diphosphorylase [Friedmanniella luteola]SDR76903.1 nicotinate-nucleotide pyrophosphorylase [carboxylating] [Friedmanniella luteola]